MATSLRPSYDYQRLVPRIAHLGFGAFHRAHQALYTDEVARKSTSNWGECVIELRSDDSLIRHLKQQKYRYHVLELGTDPTVRTIHCICKALHVETDGRDAVLEQLANPILAVVTLTISEKGYGLDPATRRLNLADPVIADDLKHPEEPRSPIGYLVAALHRRYSRFLPGFTVLSCDNMPHNGHCTRQAVLDYAEQAYPDLASWIEKEVAFPCSMVDRIVPAMTADSFARLAHEVGYSDPCGVVTEPFRQWVIEDQFIESRPQWELAGAQVVDDVTPYETMKLRMLNGSHSFLAYLGQLAGFKTVGDAISDEAIRTAVQKLMLTEQLPTIPLNEEMLTHYAEELIARFRNPQLHHQLTQIATDGSQKIPLRWLETIREHLAAGRAWPYLALAVGGWLHYLCRIHDENQPLAISDPMADTFKSLWTQSDNVMDYINNILKNEKIFGNDLSQDLSFKQIILQAFSVITERGATDAIASLNHTTPAS